MNEPVLMNAVLILPEEKNLLSTLVTFYSHKTFNQFLDNINTIKENLPTYLNLMKGDFDFSNVWTGTFKIR